MSAVILRVFFWGFLSVFVTVIEEKAWVFIRGDAEWLQWADVWVSQHIQLWHTHAHTRTLRSTEEDKNSNKHSVRLSKRERETARMRETAVKRYVQTGRLRYVVPCSELGWVGNVSGFFLSNWDKFFIHHSARCLSVPSICPVCVVGDRQAGKQAPNLLVCAPPFEGTEVKGLEARARCCAWKDENARMAFGRTVDSVLYLSDHKLFFWLQVCKDLHLNVNGWMHGDCAHFSVFLLLRGKQRVAVLSLSPVGTY